MLQARAEDAGKQLNRDSRATFLAEAERLMRRALVIDEKSYGAEHPRVAVHINNLAQLLKATNRLAEAEPLMARVVRSLERSLGGNHPSVATALNNQAQLFKATNRQPEAEPLMARVVSIFASFGRQTGHEHAHFQSAIQNYSRLLAEMNLPSDDVERRIREACGE